MLAQTIGATAISAEGSAGRILLFRIRNGAEESNLGQSADCGEPTVGGPGNTVEGNSLREYIYDRQLPSREDISAIKHLLLSQDHNLEKASIHRNGTLAWINDHDHSGTRF